MAVIRDMIPPFELIQPTTLDEALEQLHRNRKDVWVLAGGMDSFDWFKERAKRPAVVVDLGGIPELRGIREANGGLTVGAMATLTEIAESPLVQERFGLLSTAALLVATPQIRNQATLGGNLNQDVRCWYYRSGWPCYRAGGNVCYADSPTAMNREHAIMGASRCVAVSPSDTAPALVALDAEMVVRSRSGERVIPAVDYFVGPAINIRETTVVAPGELLVEVRIPARFAGARFYFEKIEDRKSWDFPLANVASAMVVTNGVIQDVRVVTGGVAATPVRHRTIEMRLRQKPLDAAASELAGELSIQKVRPLRHNDYKIALMRNLVRRAVRGTQEA